MQLGKHLNRGDCPVRLRLHDQMGGCQPQRGELVYPAYLIRYVPLEPDEEVHEKLFFQRDACSSFGWLSVYLSHRDWKWSKDGRLEYNLTELSQYTRYAYSVQTYVFGTDDSDIHTLQSQIVNDGASSDVSTFLTTMQSPSRVKRLKTVKRTPSSIMFRWRLNESEKDAIKFFYLDIVQRPTNTSQIDQRDYCANPITEEEKEESVFVEMMNEDDENCCKKCCKKTSR